MFGTGLQYYTARETLASAGELHVQRNRLDVDLLRHALHFADLHPGTANVSDHELVPGGEQSRVYGGSGCPSVAEFAVAEFGVMIGRSSGSAAKYMGQALALRHRLPRIWAQVESEHATAWKACNIASACMDLPEEAAGIVDRRVAGIIDTLSPLRLHNIVKAALWEADPVTARARAEEQARERGVWAGRTDDHGTTTLFIKAPTGAVIRFQTTINQIADALAALGDTSPINERRARAIGVIADPALAAELLQVTHHLTTNGPAATSSDTPAQSETPAEPTSSTAPRSADAPASPTARRSAVAAPSTPDPPTAPAAAPSPGIPTGPVVPTGSASPTAPAHASAAGSTLTGDRADERERSDPDEQFTAPATAEASGASGVSDGAGPSGLDSVALRGLIGKLAGIKQAASRQSSGTVLYLHLTDETLFAGQGVARVEGFGPVLVTRLEELIGHGQVIVKPVIDLKDKLATDSYEISQRIREHIKLRYPAEQFVYGTGESSRAVDLDHIEPFRLDGPPKQTNTDNLIPLRRFSHRMKTRGSWRVRRLNDDALEWTTRYGFKFIVDHQGTRPLDRM